MKKKIIALALVACLAIIAIAGATLAYFTDEDSQVNVMTTGKVDISQNEQQLGEDGELEDFEQNKPLMPMVDNIGENDPVVDTDGYFNDKMNNVVDKIVTVKNEAAEGSINQDAYVRTILAFETATEYKAGSKTEVLRDGKTIFDTYIGTLGDFELLERDTIEIDGVEYVLAVKVYEKALAPQEVSAPSLKQIFLSPDADNEVAILFGEEYKILALSQGTQVAGFEDVNGNGTAADEALDRAFGVLDGDDKIDDATLISWLAACEVESSN